MLVFLVIWCNNRSLGYLICYGPISARGREFDPGKWLHLYQRMIYTQNWAFYCALLVIIWCRIPMVEAWDVCWHFSLLINALALIYCSSAQALRVFVVGGVPTVVCGLWHPTHADGRRRCGLLGAIPSLLFPIRPEAAVRTSAVLYHRHGWGSGGSHTNVLEQSVSLTVSIYCCANLRLFNSHCCTLCFFFHCIFSFPHSNRQSGNI